MSLVLIHAVVTSNFRAGIPSISPPRSEKRRRIEESEDDSVRERPWRITPWEGSQLQQSSNEINTEPDNQIFKWATIALGEDFLGSRSVDGQSVWCTCLPPLFCQLYIWSRRRRNFVRMTYALDLELSDGQTDQFDLLTGGMEFLRLVRSDTRQLVVFQATRSLSRRT